MGIDSPIKYEWKLSWKGMPNKPVVNRLLKAMIEENVQEMENLFSQGANLEAVEEYTFQRVLYHIVGNFKVMDCIVKHGFNAVLSERYGIFRDSVSKGYECYDTIGYPWDLFARAWYLQKYDVMELLAKNGFKGELYRSRGEAKHLDMKVIFYNNELKTLKILLENGFRMYWFEECMELYPDSEVTHFLRKNPVIKLKTLALDPYSFKKIPKPQLKKEGFFNRKKVRRENDILMANYQERLDAQKRYWNSFSEEQLKRIQQKEENEHKINESTDWKLINEVLDDLLE